MTDVVPARIKIQQEEVAFNASVSESTASRMGAAINLIEDRFTDKMVSGMHGRYNIINIFPYEGIGELYSKEHPFEVASCYIYSGSLIGSSGFTVLDIKWKPHASGTYQSIFSTTPKFTTGADVHAKCYVGQSVTGFVAPILSKTQFDAYDNLRFDMIGAMAGDVEGAGLILECRPR